MAHGALSLLKGPIMSLEKQVSAKSGWGMLAATVAAFVIDIALFILSITQIDGAPEGHEPAAFVVLLVASIFVFILLFIPCMGFFSVQPGQARVLILFGTYVGTVRESGFFWANPFYSRSLGNPDAAALNLDEAVKKSGAKSDTNQAKGLSTTVSVRARTLNGERLKVNDKMGNPIEIATVVVWHVADTAKALFDVDNYPSFVAMQTETALRHVASIYAYDHMEDDDAHSSSITLRSNIEEVSGSLRVELDRRLSAAGVSVDDARLTHLAYAPEIAPAMLRRQQAEAVIAARKKIVEGAVSMVDMAVKQLSEGNVLELDDERKAVMASNLMVVLCGESEAQPVVNTSSLY